MTLPDRIPDLIQARFGPASGPSWAGFGHDPGGSSARLGDAELAGLAQLLDRRSCRDYAERDVAEEMVRLILAAGLSAPTKSDLQQADVVWVRDHALRGEVLEGIGGADSIAVAEGDQVQAGQALATVEAMEMENVLRAEKKATVKAIKAEAGASLAVDEVIMEFE